MSEKQYVSDPFVRSTVEYWCPICDAERDAAQESYEERELWYNIRDGVAKMTDEESEVIHADIVLVRTDAGLTCPRCSRRWKAVLVEDNQ